MTRLPAARRGTLLRAGAAFAAAIGLAAGMLALALVPGGAASASLGSVPTEVSTYVSSGAMVARLNDVYGPNASGTAGIKFDDTTKTGPISRVYEWTAARLADRATDHPVQLTNNWVVPVTIGGKSVGLATIWINPQTVQPELAEFSRSAALGNALTTVPATAELVRDTATGAWLALSDDKVTPLIAGRSGLTTPAPVDSLHLSSAPATPITTTEPNTGLALAIGVVGLIVVIIVIALLLPRGRRGMKKAAKAAVEPATDTAAAPTQAEPAELAPTIRESAASDFATTQSAATDKPTIAKPTASKPTIAKPTGQRTGKPATTTSTARTRRRTPTTSNAAKPASSKPTGNQQAAAGPPVSKPPSQKQPPRPRTAKPNTTQKPPASGGDSDAGPEAGSPS